MTVVIDMSIEGLRETVADMDRMITRLHGAPMARAMRTAAMSVTRVARQKAPKWHGDLARSITPEIEIQGERVVGIVGSNIKYAPWMEFGTGTFVGKKPHYPPAAALESWARDHGFVQRGWKSPGMIVAEAIGRKGGLKGRHYLENALAQEAETIYRLIGNAVGEIVA